MTPRPLTRWSSLNRSTRLRVAGTLVLACGIIAACVFYWIQVRNAPPALDEFAAGYEKARQRQMGIMMGTLGVMMVGWMDTLADPGAQAIVIALCAGLVAALCFHIAKLMDLPETDPRRWPEPEPGAHDPGRDS